MNFDLGGIIMKKTKIILLMN